MSPACYSRFFGKNPKYLGIAKATCVDSADPLSFLAILVLEFGGAARGHLMILLSRIAPLLLPERNCYFISHLISIRHQRPCFELVVP